MSNYPATVVECLNPHRKFKPDALRAVRAYARSKPWQGSLGERQNKMRRLHAALAVAYDREPAKLIFAGPNDADSGRSCYLPALDTIILRGPLSAISYLHEVSHWLRGADEREAVGWSVNLFRRVFPRSFARLRFEGHVCRADQQRNDRGDGQSDRPSRGPSGGTITMFLTGMLLMLSGTGCSFAQDVNDCQPLPWWGSVLIWLGGWLVPAIVFAGGGQIENESTATHTDIFAKPLGYATFGNGTFREVEPNADLATVWVIAYLGYWLFYGWWN